MLDAIQTYLTTPQLVLLIVALGIAFAFEFINGFHDTANAVATVIYTKALPATTAVTWSGFCNFVGVHIGGIGVAYSIVNLLPVDLLVAIDSNRGLLMVLAVLLAATLWNLGTWYLALPASSSHTLIGSILGVGLANSLMAGNGLSGVNWSKAWEVGLSLLLSPLVGFVCAAGLLWAAKRAFPDPAIHRAPHNDDPPPGWIRAILIGTCTGVSLAHGSNDGQKGMGLVMLILIGILPALYSLDPAYDTRGLREVDTAAEALLKQLSNEDLPPELRAEVARTGLLDHLERFRAEVDGQPLQGLKASERWAVRTRLLHINRDLASVGKLLRNHVDAAAMARFEAQRGLFRRPVEFVPEWVRMGVALALGIGTMIGWKRIVVTVAEKIGKEHLTYSQGACAELVAMSTIGLADIGGLPVSTTQVLSSGVAGTMWANRSGIQGATVRKIALAWVFTLPASMLLAGVFFLVGRAIVGP